MSKFITPENPSALEQKILQQAEKLYSPQVRWRRHFHSHPELSNQEYQTTQFIKEQLRKHHIATVSLKMKTGALAVLNDQKGPTVALRTDIDALPIEEKNRIAFKSKVDGVMHACGHDIHLATLLGTAVLLSNLKQHLPGGVKFFFQPAEEMPP